jgi:pilus assembly protein CpaB
MKPKTMILMVVAVSCGLGASYMTSRLLADRQGEVEKIPILVAKKTLNMGDTIKVPEDLFVEKFFPKGSEPRAAIVDPAILKGRVLRRSLRQDDHVTIEDLNDEKNPPLSVNLPQGHQAVGIRVNPESIAGGFASLPLSRVNIISTVRRGTDKDSYAKILLENVLVLAADAQTNVGPDGRAMPANVVTVALKPEDVLKLELAKTLGNISLVLRKFNDSSKSEVTKVTAEGIQTGDSSSGTEEAVPEPGGNLPVPNVPSLPPLNPKDGTLTAGVDKGPEGKAYILVITEGDQQRKVEYRLNDQGQAIANPVRRSSVQPNAPQPAPQPAPAPQKEDN